MGVAGLWDVLKPAATVRSLTHLAIKDGFEGNPDGKRGFRLGIDASIWFFHAEYVKGGENPMLRMLFFRCASLMHTTFLPVFVFDGPKRPGVKRGKKINKMSHQLIPGLKQLVEAFGFEWRMAPGEAEAELAFLNRIGAIDGILSDDVDNFLYGAQTVIRNSSPTLSGNRANPILNSAGKDDGNHTRIFRMSDIMNHPDVQLTRGGTILIGLMCGGDYDQGGLAHCGITTAHALARCGFGDSLYEAAMNLGQEALNDFLVSWRDDLRHELRTNSKGKIGRKKVALANSLTDRFPNIDTLLAYVKPITSEIMGRDSNNVKITWETEPDLAKLAGVCELFFEWGYKEAIIKKFRTVIWHSVVLRILRRAVLDLDAGSTQQYTPGTPRKRGNTIPCGTPSKMFARHLSTLSLFLPSRASISCSEEGSDDERLIIKVHSFRTHPSTDGLPEYRLEIAPAQLVRLAESGIKGLRPPPAKDEWASDDSGDKSEGRKRTRREPTDPESHLRVWMPACMAKLVEPQLIDNYEDMQKKKKLKKAKKGTWSKTTSNHRKEKALESDTEDVEAFFSAPPTKMPSITSTSTWTLPPHHDNNKLSGSDRLPSSFSLTNGSAKVMEGPPQMAETCDTALSVGRNGGHSVLSAGLFGAGQAKHMYEPIPSPSVTSIRSAIPSTSTWPLMDNMPVVPASQPDSILAIVAPTERRASIVNQVPASSLKRKSHDDVHFLPHWAKKSPRMNISQTSPHGQVESLLSRMSFQKKSFVAMEISRELDQSLPSPPPLGVGKVWVTSSSQQAQGQNLTSHVHCETRRGTGSVKKDAQHR